MAGLIAPTPVVEPLLAKNPASPAFLVEVPLAVRSAPPTLPDGTAVGPERLAVAGCHVFRRAAAFAAAEVWDGAQSAWLAELSPQGKAARPLPMSFHAHQPLPWLAVFGNAPAAGGGASMFEARGPTGFPVYFARTAFQTRAGGQSGGSADSAPVSFQHAAERSRPQLELIPGDPETATTLILRLRNAGGEAGSLRVSDGAGGTLELKSSGGARVTLTAGGDVVLAPRAGGRVLVDGRLVGHSPVTGDHDLFVP